MNQELTPIFTSLLKKSFAEPEFTSLEDNQYGEFVKGFTDNFISSYKLDDADNKRYYESLAETTLGSYRKRNDIPRFVPTSEQSQELFERFPDLSLVDNIDDREKKVDEWRSRSFEKASAIRPAEREDIGVYLDALSNNFIRESASELNQTNWVGDKAYRFAEAFVRPVHELIDKPGAERAWAKTAPEDPNRDEDFTSMLASGFGQAGMQILTAATLTAAGQPELVPYVFGAMYGAQYMKDGYYEEMRRSGDEDKAWNNAVSQLPAAALDTFGDIVLTRGVTKTARGYGKAFASATTEAEKRAVLREALPSMGKEIGNQFISEGLVGGFGADFASGIGSYLATGNEDYLNSFGDMVKSGLAEGLVGAVTGGAVRGLTQNGIKGRLAEDISVLTGFEDIKTKQEGINEALKRRDFDKVISLTNGQFVDPSQFDAHLEASDTLRGRATDENGEPIAKPKDKNDYSGRVPVSSPITSTAKNSLIAEATLNDSEISKLSALPSRTEEEEQKLSALTERNTYVKGVIESINNKTYENPTEVDLTFDDSNEAFYEGKESKEKPKREGVHEVVLENGETLNDDGAVVYFDKKFQQDFNTAVAHYGKENVSIKRNVNGNTANIYINKDGKWIKTNAESSYNVNPSKGAVPVSFVENEDSKSVKVKFHPTVKDSTKLPANFTIVEDTGDSVKVRHSDGRVFTFTGDRAIAAREMNAKREEVKQAKEDKKKKPDKTEKSKDSGKQLPSLLDDSEINQENPVSEEKFTQKKVNQNDPMSVLVDEELRSLSNSERKKLSPGRFERQSLSDVSDKGVDLWHEGKRGRVKKDATTGRFYFEAEDKTQIELNGNQESSLVSVGITKGGKPGSPKEKVSLTTNKPSSEKKQSHKTLISSLKEKLDQIHHDSIDRLSSISGIINKLISLGVEYKVMSREEIAKEYGENNSPGFATSDGKIVFNLDALNATNKHDLLFKILAIHESAHAGIYIVARDNPELYQAAKESVNNNPELIAIAREEYGKYDNGNYRFDSMNQDGIFHETIRMIIEGRLAGRTTGLSESGPLKAFLQKLIDYIRNIMWRTSDRIVFQFVKNVEDVLGVTNSAIKIENENITVNDIPSNIVSDFVRIINGEDVDLENYKRDQLRDLADLMRIKRDRPDIKERLLSRIKEYKPISDSSNTNIINNSQPIIVGSDFFADSGKFYRVIQGDESLNDILQSGEVRTNAAEKIKSGMTLAEKMAARPTAFPSFSKGSASMSYAAENPNHSIIVTADKSLQPSTSGRHSAGKTHFPTVDGVHQKSLGNNFQVYKHIGNGEYELVFDKGMKVDRRITYSLAPVSQAQDTDYLAAVKAGDSGSDNLLQLLRNAPESNRRVVVDAWLRRNPKAAANMQRLVNDAALSNATKVTRHTEEKTDTPLDGTYRVDVDGILYRTVTQSDWDRIESQGFLDSDQRNAVSRNEGVNLANNALSSITYAIPGEDSVLLGIKPEGIGLHGYTDDSYIRTWDKIPYDSIIPLGKFIGQETKPSYLADITYDESGNVIPRSQRFDSTNNNIQNSQPINLGDKFSFRLANVIRNAEDTLLGLKIANDGTLPTQSLIAKISKSGINEFEVEELTNLVNSLGINGRVNISELSESIDNEPTLVVNTLDFGGTSNSKPYQIEIQNLTVKKNEIFHKIDTEFSGWTYDQYLSVFTSPDGKSMPLSQAIEAEPRGRSMPQKMQDYVNQAIEIQKQISSIQLDNEGVIDMSKSGSATGRFGVDPYSIEVLKGLEEIEPGHRLIWSGDLSLNIPSGENKIIRQRKVDNYEQINAFANEVKFTSQHYQGEVADNQLAFVRGGIHEYQKGNVLPDGTTATETTRIFEIWEVQSDWAASSDSIYKDGVYVGAFVDGVLTDSNINLKDYDENISDNISEPKDTKEGRASLIKNGYTIEKKSPLIKYWESLALKAALNHARKQGASNVIISDADTVMMTEGHDFERLAPNPVSMPDPISPGTYIVMDSGYIIPNSSFKTKKEADDFKDNYLRNYLPPRPSQEKGMRAAYDERIPNGFAKLTNSKGKKVTVGEHNKGPSNVFKNPDGTPKNTNTGRMYPVNNSVELQFSQPITNDSFLNEGIEEYKKLGWNYKKWGIIPQDLANKSVLEAVLNDPSLSESEKETIQSFAPGGEKFKTINALNSQPITNENITEEEVIDLASLSGESVSIVRKNQIKRINELRKRKIEAKLGPEEKSALSVLKGIKALAALPDESLEAYANLMEDFIDTRSRSDDAAIERIPIEEFLSKVHALDSEAKHAWFKQQQEDFPELQSKDFDKDFHSEMDQVKAAIDSIQENDQSIGLGRVNKNKEMYLEKIDALRDLIIDNIDEMKDNMLRRIDDVTFNKTDSQHLKAGTWLMQDTMDDLRQYFEDYLNSILTIDVSQSSAKDVRKAYYSLMGVAYDGYMLNANNFISSEIMSLLQNEASPLQVFKSKNTAENATKLMSISAQMRSTMDTKGYEILNRIAGKFRESIKKSHMFQQNALIPYQKESIEKAQKESGFNYSDTHLQKIGIYALSRRIRISEDPKSEIERNLKQLKDSVINLSRSADATLNAASEWYNNFIDGLFSGVLNSETPLQKLEENASIIGIDDGMKGYVNDIVGFFDHFKPIARFTTEFIYGREFKEEYNYIPSMILNLNPTSGPMQYDVDDLRFDMNSSDIAERNVNVSGLSGTYDRKAQLKQNQAMVFNINHLFSNRGRLNFLDSLSAVPRREIAALFRQDSEGSKAVKSFMHDEHGSKFRYHTLENAFRTMWKNEIESTQYLHEYQGFVNGILSRWAGVVLSSAYQGVGQLISNIAPFITVNIANPGKIMDMFSAFSYASKYRFGMLTDAQAHLYERLMFDLKNRHQDQVLDTSVNLGITKDSTWQAFKASAAAQGLSKVDKFVEKAKFFQFQEADFWSGAPMMMAEYLHQEKKRLGHDVKMEDLIYNEGSYFNAIDETERFIGIGNASRRGEWLTNRNVLITVLRHILTGFAGHRLNNASNAYIEMRKIATDGISVEEKTKSAAYVASIAVQSATFTAAKVFVISGIMSLVASILKDKDDDDEELKKLLDEASRANPADKKVIEAEISKRKEIRSTWENVQRRQDNSYLMTMNLTKDIASNIFIWPNLLEFAPDVLIYSTADAFEEKAFKDFKEKKMKELKTKMTNARNLGDKVLANRFQLAMASLSSQQAVKVTMPNQGSLVPFNGMYGGAFRNIESVVKAMRDSYLGVDEFNINDFANLATVFGWSTADIQRFTRVAEDLDRANKNYQEKVNPTGKNK